MVGKRRIWDGWLGVLPPCPTRLIEAKRVEARPHLRDDILRLAGQQLAQEFFVAAFFLDRLFGDMAEGGGIAFAGSPCGAQAEGLHR